MTNYESTFFSIHRCTKKGDETVVIFDVAKSWLVNGIKSPVMSSIWYTIEEIDSSKLYHNRYKMVIDDAHCQVEYYLNNLDIHMMGRDFNAKDHYLHLDDFPYIKGLADAIIDKKVFEGGKYQELVDKLDNYIFENSPFYYTDDKHYDYINTSLFYSGVNGLLDRIAELDMIKIDTWRTRKSILKDDVSEVLNEYDSSVIHQDSLDYFNSFAEHSLIPHFAVKTNGFNQDFRGVSDKDEYSSVSIKKWRPEDKFHVRINGADDCSYGKDFDTLEDAKLCVRDIKCVSTILMVSHLYKMGFVFTN